MLAQCTKFAGVFLLALTSLSAADAVAQKITSPAAPGSQKSVAMVGQKPQFKGGVLAMQNFIESNIKHPEPDRAATVYVSFNIDADGSIQDVKVRRGVNEAFDKEAIRVVQLMDKQWEPGMQDGKPVKIKQDLGIHFRYDFKPDAIAGDIGAARPNEAAAADAEKPYTFAEKMPSFKGGDMQMFKYINEQVKYPEAAVQKGIEGQVFVSFVIGKDGSISNINVIRGLGAGTDEEAIRVIQSMNGKWEPGMQNGRVVPVRYNLPVKFSLSKGSGSKTAGSGTATAAKKLPVVADSSPAYKGGTEALHRELARQLELPEDESRKHPYASLTIKFVVEKDGSLTNITLAQTKVIKTISPDSEFDYMDGNKIGLLSKTTLAHLAETAASALKSTSGSWEAGTRNGSKERVEMELPVTYPGKARPVIGEAVAPGAAEKPLKLLKNDAKYKGDRKSMLRFISGNITYPAGAPDRGLATVYLTLDRDNQVSGYRIMRSAPDLEAEVRRVMDSVVGSRLEQPTMPSMDRHTLTISFQTHTSKGTDEAIPPADIYVERYK